MSVLKSKRIQREPLIHREGRVLLSVSGALVLVCLKIATVLCILFACGYLVFAFFLREPVLGFLALVFALLAFALGLAPGLLQKMRDRFLDKIEEQNRREYSSLPSLEASSQQTAIPSIDSTAE